MNIIRRLAHAGSYVLTVGAIAGIVASLMTGTDTLGHSPLGYTAWLLGGTLSSISILSLIFLPWQGGARVFGIGSIIFVALFGLLTGTVKPILLLASNTPMPYDILFAGALVLALMALVISMLFVRAIRAEALWYALGATIVSSFMAVNYFLPTVAVALPYVATLIISVHARKIRSL